MPGTEDAGQLDRLLTRREVERRLGVSRPTIYKWMAGPERFPRPVKLGRRAVRWRAADVEGWLASQPRSAGGVA